MNPYITQLKIHLSENEPNYGGGGTKTIWEMLYRCYAECNPLQTEQIHAALEQLNECLSKLTIKENDRVYDLVSDLCLDCEKTAFYAGLQVGCRLAAELEESP